MTRRFTHARSTRHLGPVCSADEGGHARVTDEDHLVTCPDCPDAAALEAVPDDADTGDPHVIAMLREAEAAGQPRTIDGWVVDTATARAILAVYVTCTPRTQVKIAGLPLPVMASLAWNVLHRETEDPR